MGVWVMAYEGRGGEPASAGAVLVGMLVALVITLMLALIPFVLPAPAPATGEEQGYPYGVISTTGGQ